MPKRLFFLLVIGFSSFCFQGIGRQELVSKQEVEEIKKQKEYWYADLPLELPKPKENVRRSMSIPGIVGPILNFLMWLMVGVAITFFLYYLSQNIDFESNKKTETNNINPSNEVSSERELRELNYSDLVLEAVQLKNYRLAIRWHYLWILKELSAKDKIVYNRYKTNNEYKQRLKEVLGEKHQYLPVFAKAIKYYEYAWFGNFPINEVQYNEIEKEFKSAINSI